MESNPEDLPFWSRKWRNLDLIKATKTSLYLAGVEVKVTKQGWGLEIVLDIVLFEIMQITVQKKKSYV